jgi:hypothetical protein
MERQTHGRTIGKTNRRKAIYKGGKIDMQKENKQMDGWTSRKTEINKVTRTGRCTN